jgi:RNA polymerase sigma-70 factor (ECF subfamily)
VLLLVSRFDSQTDELLALAAGGDRAARNELLALHRGRLRQMVALRMDRRLAARVDPSDVVQEALTEANRTMNDYLRERPLPFYAWLRRLAWERLVALSRRHIRAGKRSVTREQRWSPPVSEGSAAVLASRLAADGTNPSGRMLREELQVRVRHALDQLDEHDREVLLLRYVEQLSTEETAGVLTISEGAVKSRLLRALVRLRDRLDESEGE